jgi:2-keto-4-pentenoate hydratase/2-oxohepta-3-ene-1,7-dioic acid hydratase in catechol pathway
MKLANLLIDSKPQLCLLREETYITVSETDPNLSNDICSFLENVDWKALTQTAHKNLNWQPVPPRQWLPPLSLQSRIFCVGKNYKDHAKEMGVSETTLEQNRPANPDIFIRFPSSFSAHNSTIYYPKAEETFDYEGELAVIIGKGGKNITSDNAEDYIFGYSIANDGTIRRVQKQTSQFTLGKNFDQSGALGPTITHKSAFDLSVSHSIITKVNHIEKQNGIITGMIFSVAEIIAAISTVTELCAGDIILTGTPAGVGAGRIPPEFLQDGDQVTIEISNLGVLSLSVKTS